MHYYKRNIGDYAKKAGRLSMIEHGAYTLLLDACYDRERFPTLDEAIDWLWVRGDDEIAAVTFVLNKFFDLKADGRYIQSRIQDELGAYQAQASTNQRIAREREAKRREDRKAMLEKQNVEHEACESVDDTSTKRHLTTNHKPLTTNQEPLTNLKDNVIEKALNVSFDDFWNLYDKKKDRGKCELKWVRMTDEQRELTMQHLPAYVESTPDKTFRKDPATYLNNKSWENEIISNNKGVNHVSHNPIISAVNSSSQQPRTVQEEIEHIRRLKAERNNESGNGIRTVS